MEKRRIDSPKGGCTDQEAERNVSAGPFKRFADMRMLRHTKRRALFRQLNTRSNRTDPVEKRSGAALAAPLRLKLHGFLPGAFLCCLHHLGQFSAKQGCFLFPRLVNGELAAQGVYLGADLIAAALKVPGHPAHPGGDLHHLRLPEAPGGDGGGAHPDAAGDKGLFRVVGNGVFVDGDLHRVQTALATALPLS